MYNPRSSWNLIWKKSFWGDFFKTTKMEAVSHTSHSHRGENLQERQATPRKPVEPGWEPETMSGVSDLFLTIPIHIEYHYHYVLNGELSQPKLGKVTEPRTKPQPSDPNIRASVAFTTAWTLSSESVWRQPPRCFEGIYLTSYISVSWRDRSWILLHSPLLDIHDTLLKFRAEWKVDGQTHPYSVCMDSSPEGLSWNISQWHLQ